MKQDALKELSKKLKQFEDIEPVSIETGYPKDFLLVVLTQKISRNATSKFYTIKNQTERLLRKWEDGKSIYTLATEIDFPPILLAMMLFMHRGMNRKAFWEAVREPGAIRDKRMREEFIYFIPRDVVYSPIGNHVQKRRGRDGEDLLNCWLDSHGLKYYVEEELRKQFPKTPDSLLFEPITVGDKEVYWIESKANFGDVREVNRNLKKQLLPYTELFGPGMVVYWYDYVETDTTLTDIQVVNGSFFLNKGKHQNRGLSIKNPPYDPFEFSGYDAIKDLIEEAEKR